MKKFIPILFTFLVSFSNYSYSFASGLETMHFPKITAKTCFDGTIYQTTYSIVAWDGQSTASDTSVLATIGESVVYTDVVSIPITKTFYSVEAPDYIQVEAGTWNDGWVGGHSGGGLAWSDICQTATAETVIDEPESPAFATISISDFILTKEGAAAFKSKYGIGPETKSGCFFDIFEAKEGDFYEFECSAVSPEARISDCSWPISNAYFVQKSLEDEQNVSLSITFLKDVDPSEQIHFSCGVIDLGNEVEAVVAASANTFSTQREVPVWDSLEICFLPSLSR